MSMPTANSWISFSLPPIEMLLRPSSHDQTNIPFPFPFPQDDGSSYQYQFLPQPLKLEDFLGGHRSSPLDHCSDTVTEGQDSSSLTIHQDLRAVALPVNSVSSELDDSVNSVTGNKLSLAGQSPESFPQMPSSAAQANLVRSVAEKTTATVGSCQRTSVYRGVTRHRWTGRYEAHLWDNSCRREGQKRKGRQVYLGGYDNEEKAARAYDLAALKYWGLGATTNFPVKIYCQELEVMKDMTKQEFIASLRRKSSGFSRGASIYRGVTRHHQHGRWQARIGRVAGNKDLYLGTFASEAEAAEAYDVAAIKFRGSNAVTNFELNRYNVEAIANTELPIGASAKRMKQSLQASNNTQLTATSSATSELPNTEPPAFFHNLLQLQTTVNPSASLAYCSLGDTCPDLCSQSFYWLTANSQHGSQIHSNQLALGSEILQLTHPEPSQ